MGQQRRESEAAASSSLRRGWRRPRVHGVGGEQGCAADGHGVARAEFEEERQYEQ
jgi:hypothetical protein